jgi:peptide/nickel transport system substrate-binding protein
MDWQRNVRADALRCGQVRCLTGSRHGSRPDGDLDSPYGEPRSVDPVVADNNQSVVVVQNLRESLMVNNFEEIVPNLAMSIDASAGGLSCRISVRPGVTFWDGSPSPAGWRVLAVPKHSPTQQLTESIPAPCW